MFPRKKRGFFTRHYKAIHASDLDNLGNDADEQLLFHLFDILFKCLTCLDVKIPRDKHRMFPAFTWTSRKFLTRHFPKFCD